MKMKKMIVQFTESQHRDIRVLAKRQGKSMSQVVRDGLDRLMACQRIGGEPVDEYKTSGAGNRRV